MNVLVISDEKSIRKQAHELLTHRGRGISTIMIIPRGIDAVNELRKRRYDVILTHTFLEAGLDVHHFLQMAKIVQPEVRILLMAEALGPGLTSTLTQVGAERGFLSVALEYGLQQSELIS
jgi:DNA-binding NtrC family response regulator